MEAIRHDETHITPVSNRTRQASITPATARSRLRQGRFLLGLAWILAGGVFLSPAAAEDLQEEQFKQNVTEEPEGPRFVIPPQPEREYLDAIDLVESERGPYATALSDLYLGLGESLLQKGDYEEARDAFNRGVMVLRVNSGPNSPEQTNHLYLIANIETILGERKAADDILQNIYFINSNFYGENSPEMLPVLKRMYEWYMVTRPLGSDDVRFADYERAIELTEKMANLSNALNGPGHADTVVAYRRLGQAHFQTVRHLMSEGVSVEAYELVSSGTLQTPGVVVVSVRKHFVAGRKAFERYLESLQQDESKTALDYAEALAEMGDWHLAFEKYRTARHLYEEAYHVLAESEDYAGLAENFMDRPRPAHYLADQPGFFADPAAEFRDDSLDISMTVTSLGDVRYVEILNAPEGMSEDYLGQIKRQLRGTPFRPALKGGEVVTTEGFILQYAIEPQAVDPEERTS